MSKNRNSGHQLPVWVSQNFLTSKRIIKSLLNITSIDSRDHVIEIGPGKGHITSLLLQSCRKVTAVELDEKLYGKLLEKFKSVENLSLYRNDFLKWQLPFNGGYKVFANIPFCHTTDIVRKLAESKNQPIDAWLTMEKGAARRFLGKPHETLRSLMLKPVFELKIVYYFQSEDFHPMPGVDVVLLHLKKKAQPDILPSQWGDYERFVSSALRNNGAELRRMFTKKQLSLALREAGIINLVSSEMLYSQWLCLFRCYYRHVLHKASV